MIRRTPLQRKAPPKRERRLPTVPETPPAVRSVMARAANELVAQPKAQTHRDARIRASANGEPCLVRLPGCPGEPRMTIWSHYRGSAGGKGLGLKSHDVAGAYGCTYCDAIYDGQRPRPAGMTQTDVELAWHEGHIRSLGRLHEKGLI
jgi:hypothetical protein